MPDFKFTCNDSIASWSALLAYECLSTNFVYRVLFQVWRPMSNGRYYQLVGFNEVYLFRTSILQDSQDANTCYTDIASFPVPDENMVSFMPNDILGFFIQVNDAGRPFVVTYHNQTDQDDLETDMYVIRTNEQRCQMSTRKNLESEVFSIQSVIPNIYVTFNGTVG